MRKMYLHHLSKSKRKLFKQFWNQNVAAFKKRSLKQCDVINSWMDGITVGKLLSKKRK